METIMGSFLLNIIIKIKDNLQKKTLRLGEISGLPIRFWETYKKTP